MSFLKGIVKRGTNFGETYSHIMDNQRFRNWSKSSYYYYIIIVKSVKSVKSSCSAAFPLSVLLSQARRWTCKQFYTSAHTTATAV